jgi:autotransporter-associated beta strand protein
MHLDRRFLGWGVFFLVAGGIPLAQRTGYLDADTVGQLWRFWPLILVGIGAGILLSRTALSWLGGLIVAATFGILVGTALAGGAESIGCGFDSDVSSQPGTTVGGELAEGATVDVRFSCGPLQLTVAPGTAFSFTHRGTPAPDIQQAPERLVIETPDGTFFPRGVDWDLTLPSGRTLALSVEANAGSYDLDLAGAQLSSLKGAFNAGSVTLDLTGATLSSLDVRINAGSGTVTLPSASFTGRLDVNAGSLDLCAPADVGLRITTSGALSSTDFAGSGLVLSGSTWESPGFASAATRIELTINANAASVSLRRGGCS